MIGEDGIVMKAKISLVLLHSLIGGLQLRIIERSMIRVMIPHCKCFGGSFDDHNFAFVGIPVPNFDN